MKRIFSEAINFPRSVEFHTYETEKSLHAPDEATQEVTRKYIL